MDLCVKCGLCLPHCPTYKLTRNEADSPRGRISLIQGMEQGHLAASPTLFQHLDRCLQCRACERVCPSEVPFGDIIDQGLTNISSQAPLKSRILSYLIKHSQLQTLTYLRKKLSWLNTPIYKRAWLRSAPASQSVTRPKAPLKNGAAVVLFHGCLTHNLDPETLANAERVLSFFNLHITHAKQTCCGAMAYHNGQVEPASKQIRDNINTLLKAGRPIVFLATGCGIFLQEYGDRLDEIPAQNFATQTLDICDFILDLEWPNITPTQTLKIALHTPCSAKTMKQTPSVSRLLARIPHLDIIPLASPDCCGGAGSYTLRQPTLSDQLIDQQIQALSPPYPEYLVTTNLGCALQFSSAFKYHHINTKVIHPITLVAKAFGLH